MDNQQKWYSIKSLENKLRIPNTTLRRYIRQHGHHLNIKKDGKSYLVAEESIPLLKKIRSLYDQGKSIESIEKGLKNEGHPITITIDDYNENTVLTLNESLEDIRNSLTSQMNEQKQIIQSLIQTVHEQRHFFETKLEERDKHLLDTLKENQELKKQLASTHKKKWWEFWK
ncbi:DUF3967 domain-containing protein [Bacillus sp. NPDC093026]|uniref:DUF3967 domain-containing protein n=1 Tax=Bacillus sp. NPDC093026 TaxID=3363948 RepID=UPI0037F727B7